MSSCHMKLGRTVAFYGCSIHAPQRESMSHLSAWECEQAPAGPPGNLPCQEQDGTIVCQVHRTAEKWHMLGCGCWLCSGSDDHLIRDIMAPD